MIVREESINGEFFVQNFKIERDDFEEELGRLSYTNEQIISETSIEGAENLKFKLKQLQNKWRTFNTELHSFEVTVLRLLFSLSLSLAAKTHIQRVERKMWQALSTMTAAQTAEPSLFGARQSARTRRTSPRRNSWRVA